MLKLKQIRGVSGTRVKRDFPDGARQLQRWRRQPINFANFYQNLHENKDIGQRWGEGIRGTPPPPLIDQCNVTLFASSQYKFTQFCQYIAKVLVYSLIFPPWQWQWCLFVHKVGCLLT